jgi:hypothetical protein
MEITGHVDCRKGGANFSSHSHKSSCQLAVFISFDLLRSMWLVNNLQQTLSLKTFTSFLQTPDTDFFFNVGIQTLV